MHAIVANAELIGQALSHLRSVTTKGSADTLAEAILFEATNPMLRLTYCDMASHQFVICVPAQVQVPKKFLFKPDNAGRILSAIGKVGVTLKADARSLVTSSGANDSQKFTLYQGDPATYGLMAALPAGVAKLSYEQLVRAIRFAQQVSMYPDQGIAFKADGDSMVVVLQNDLSGLMRIRLDKAASFHFDVLQSQLRHRMPFMDGEVELHVAESRVGFSQDSNHVQLVASQGVVEVANQVAISKYPAAESYVVDRKRLLTWIKAYSVGKDAPTVAISSKNKKLFVAVGDPDICYAETYLEFLEPPKKGIAVCEYDINLFGQAIEALPTCVKLRVDLLDLHGDGKMALRFRDEESPEAAMLLLMPLQR